MGRILAATRVAREHRGGRRRFAHRSPLAVFLALALVAAGCGTTSSDDDAPVRVAVLNVLSFGPFFMADVEGYFDEVGIEVELIEIESSATAVAATIAGEFDVLSGTMSAGVINAVAAGEGLRVVADKGSQTADSCAYLALLASSRLAGPDGGVPPESIPGSTFSVGNSLTFQWFLDRFLEPLGIEADDVSIQNVSRPVLAESLESGALDFAFTGEPWVTRIVDNGSAIAASGSDLAPDFQWGYMAYGPRLLEDEELGERFMVAYMRGVRQYREGKTDRNIEILAAATGLDADTLNRSCWPDIRADVRYEPGSLDEIIEWGVGAGFVDTAISGEELVESRFADHANEELGAP